MNNGILIGYYGDKDEARRALRELMRQGFHRIALVRRSADGAIHTGDPFLWRLAFRISVAAALSGGIGWITSLLVQPSQLPLRHQIVVMMGEENGRSRNAVVKN